MRLTDAELERHHRKHGLTMPQAKALQTIEYGGGGGAAAVALETRGLASREYRREVRRHGCIRTPAGTDWSLTEAGKAVLAAIRVDEAGFVQAARDAEGCVTVPMWALRCVLRLAHHGSRDEAEAVLAAVLP